METQNEILNVCAPDTDFTPEEIQRIAEIKRFSEWFQADAALRARLNAKEGFSAEDKAWMRTIGIHLDEREMAFLWEHPLETNGYLLRDDKSLETELDDGMEAVAAQYPLLKLWGGYSQSFRKKRKLLEQWGKLPSPHEAFHAWRQRRIASAKSELGFLGMQLGHPVFAYELNAGCSVGCWFCSFATDKLSGTLNYPKERGAVLSIIRQCGDLFGKQMVQLSLPYYRTEPYDNPHYINFLKDFEKETGAVLCTSTAVCHDLDWIRALMAYYQKREDGLIYNWPRLSILTLDILKRIHSAFSPLETKDIELLIQVRDNTRPKVTGGRILQEQAGLRSVEDFETDRLAALSVIPQGTIACVSGFNINLVTRTVMLFSPCYTSNRWPHGFRVYGEVKYTDENDFSDAVRDLVNRAMFLSPPKDKPLRFRDDIVFRPTEAGFDLATPHQLHHFKGRSKCGPLGELIAESVHTYDSVTETLLREHKVNPILLRAAIQQLFDDGMIDEVYD